MSQEDGYAIGWQNALEQLTNRIQSDLLPASDHGWCVAIREVLMIIEQETDKHGVG